MEKHIENDSMMDDDTSAQLTATDNDDDDELSPTSAKKIKMQTIRCPRLHINPFPASAAASSSAPSTSHLSSYQAASLIVAIIQHLIVQLQLTSSAWPDLEQAFDDIIQQQQSEETSKKLSSKKRKFVKMMEGLHSLFETLMRVFIAPISACGSSDKIDDFVRSYPTVQEILLMFDISEAELCSLCESHVSCQWCLQRIFVSYVPMLRPPQDPKREKELIQSLSRNVIRQLMNNSELTVLDPLPRKLLSPSMKMHVLLRLNQHPPNEWALRANSSSHQDEPSTVDYFEYTRMQFKPQWHPRLCHSYQIPLPPSPEREDDVEQGEETDPIPDDDDELVEQQTTMKRKTKKPKKIKRMRIKKPKRCIPHLLILSPGQDIIDQVLRASTLKDERRTQSGDMTAEQEEAIDDIWYRFETGISLTKEFPGV